MRVRDLLAVSTFALVGALAAFAACTTQAGDFPTVDYTDGAAQLDGGGADGDSSVVFPVTGCEPSPKDDPSVIEDRCGAFVAPSVKGGSDTTGDGTRARPFARKGNLPTFTSMPWDLACSSVKPTLATSG